MHRSRLVPTSASSCRVAAARLSPLPSPESVSLESCSTVFMSSCRQYHANESVSSYSTALGAVALAHALRTRAVYAIQSRGVGSLPLTEFWTDTSQSFHFLFRRSEEERWVRGTYINQTLRIKQNKHLHDSVDTIVFFGRPPPPPPRL